MQRRDSKPEIHVARPARFAGDGWTDKARGWIVRLSIAGAEIEALQPPDIGSQVWLWAELVDGEGELALTGRVQWATSGAFAVQFGSLGVRETRSILRASSRPPPP